MKKRRRTCQRCECQNPNKSPPPRSEYFEQKRRKLVRNIGIEERYLTPRGIIRDLSHEGDMAGNFLHWFLCNAGSTFADVKEYLLEEPDLRKKMEEEKRTIVTLCDNTMLVMQLLEAFLATEEVIAVCNPSMTWPSCTWGRSLTLGET
jgi:hypothetical protein